MSENSSAAVELFDLVTGEVITPANTPETEPMVAVANPKPPKTKPLKAAPLPKAAKAKAKPASPKKETPKTAPSANGQKRGRAPKDGLRKPQIMILRGMLKAKKPLTRNEIADVSKVDPTKIGDYAGPRPDNQTEKSKARYPFPDLVSLKLLLVQRLEGEPQKYTLSALGRKALEKIPPGGGGDTKKPVKK